MTSIDKTPKNGPTRVEELGVEGDQVTDTKHHGGVYQAVYAFAREDLDLWGERLGARLPDGRFGENLTTDGIDVNEALIGERWRVGTALLEVITAYGFQARTWSTLSRVSPEFRSSAPGPSKNHAVSSPRARIAAWIGRRIASA